MGGEWRGKGPAPVHAVWLGGAVGAMGRLCRGEARGTGPEDAAGKMRLAIPCDFVHG